MPTKDPIKLKAKSRRHYLKYRARILDYKKSRLEISRQIYRTWAINNPKKKSEHLRKYKASHPDYVKDYNRRSYVRVAFANFTHKCNRCSGINKLQVHHIDRNRRNNIIDNLEILCQSCHIVEHS